MRRALPRLRKRYGVASLGVFGSCTRHQARKAGFVDILVDFRNTVSLFEFQALERELAGCQAEKWTS